MRKEAIQFLKQMVTSHSGISSKRVCGVVGFCVSAFILLYCTIGEIQAPKAIETFMYICAALLGVDSITGIWKNFNK